MNIFRVTSMLLLTPATLNKVLLHFFRISKEFGNIVSKTLEWQPFREFQNNLATVPRQMMSDSRQRKWLQNVVFPLLQFSRNENFKILFMIGSALWRLKYLIFFLMCWNRTIRWVTMKTDEREMGRKKGGKSDNQITMKDE